MPALLYEEDFLSFSRRRESILLEIMESFYGLDPRLRGDDIIW